MKERLQFYAMMQRLVLAGLVVWCVSFTTWFGLIGAIFITAALFLLDYPRERL